MTFLLLRAAATALLVRGSFGRPGWDLLGWVALAPAFYDIANSRNFREALLAGAVHGFAAGCGFWGWVLWIGDLKGTELSLLVRIFLICSATMAVSLAATAFVERAARARFGRRSEFAAPVAAAAAWTACEYGWSLAFVGVTHSLAYSQWGRAAVIQVADLAGLYGVSFAVALVSCGLGSAAAGRRKSLLPGAAALALLLAYGGFRLAWPVPTRPGPDVALLQGAWWPARSASAGAMRAEVESVYLPLARAAAGADLIVWPESSVPVLEGEPGDEEFPLGRRAAAETRTAQLFGASLPVPGEPGKIFNSAVLLGPDGRKLAEYDRRFPMPFGEYVPGPFKWLVPRTISGEIEPGRHPAVVDLPGMRGALTLCGESFESVFTRGLVGEGAQAVISLANSLWTGDTPGTTITFAVGPYRAVENRVSFVRVDTMGPSAVWGPDGRAVAWLPFGRRGAVRVRVPISTAPGSYYSRHGDWFAFLCAVVAAVAALAALA